MISKLNNYLSSRLDISLWSKSSWFLVLGMQITWLSLWYRRLSKPQADSWQLTIFWILLVFGSFFVAHQLEKLQARPLLQRALALLWIIACAIIPAFIFIWQPEIRVQPNLALGKWIFSSPEVFNRILTHLAITMLTAWHILDLGQRVFSRELIQKEFEFGCVAFLIYGLVYYSSQSATILTHFVVFLILGLLGLGTARIAEQEAVRGGRLPRVYSLWPLLLVGISALVALISFVLSSTVGVPLASILAQLALLVLSGLALLIILILSPVLALILEAAYNFGQRIFTELPNLIPQSAAQQAADNIVDTSQEALDMVTTQNGRPVLLIAVILLILGVAILSLRFRYYRRALRPEEQSESLSRDSRRLGKPDQPMGKTPRFRWVSARKALAAARIRIVYAQLIDLSTRMGHPRPPAVTPAEFLPTLNSLWPEHSQELALITNAYQKVRYGQFPETKSEVEDVLMAWKEIQKSGFIKKAQNK